ncbi:HNH endonuclease [Enterocloster clostridioformis]|jgi:hypothetical protein|uniref:HNH domain-containing protein n=1 Tax=[Clostridium] clostridioforme 90A8 TaxID=999408 RepID=A0A0E2HAF7_9FIRM|nr:HNH endonuclease [Enterocloster clostridioformis]ENZ14042.1 hypothetical protein HMPREF1090_02334 [[Clostridium] clostridioforme 90A8]
MKKCDFCGNPLNKTQYVLVNHILYKSCPSCSQKCNEHIHYFCPEAFGTTSARRSSNDPLGMQSQCAKCRSSKEGPHENALPCSALGKSKGHIINEIRFLPMGKAVFSTEELVVDFLSHTMPERGYTYYYQASKMNCVPGTLVFFQYNGKLWGYAMHTSTVELEEPFEDDGSIYTGYYEFAPETLSVFNAPITAEDFSKIDVTFKRFGQAAQSKSVSFMPAIMELLNRKGKKSIAIHTPQLRLPEELDDADLNIKEGAKKQITVNAYERNPKARAACIKHYRKKNGGKLVCEICGFDFGAVYGANFADKIHIHHIVEISTIGEEYEVDARRDLIPICPNCHLVAHSKKPAYTPAEIKQMIGK